MFDISLLAKLQAGTNRSPDAFKSRLRCLNAPQADISPQSVTLQVEKQPLQQSFSRFFGLFWLIYGCTLTTFSRVHRY